MANIEREKHTVAQMMRIYCFLKHKKSKGLCGECISLLSYAQKRLDGCKFGNDKPACVKCSVHCYQPVMRERIRIVMRFSGPLMPFVHPIETMEHYIPRLFADKK
jgi:hypothetical protein